MDKGVSYSFNVENTGSKLKQTKRTWNYYKIIMSMVIDKLKKRYNKIEENDLSHLWHIRAIEYYIAIVFRKKFWKSQKHKKNSVKFNNMKSFF